MIIDRKTERKEGRKKERSNSFALTPKVIPSWFATTVIILLSPTYSF